MTPTTPQIKYAINTGVTDPKTGGKYKYIISKEFPGHIVIHTSNGIIHPHSHDIPPQVFDFIVRFMESYIELMDQ